jgi:hypothetical protein
MPALLTSTAPQSRAVLDRWIFGTGFFYVIGNVAISRTPSVRALKCMLWCYMAIDFAIGFSLMIYGFVVVAQGDMPVLALLRGY